MRNLLNEFYPDNEIFITDAQYVDGEPAIEVTCLVPNESTYTLVEVNYVTAENYVRCLSQTSVLFVEHLLKQGLVSVGFPAEKLREVFERLWYRNLAMTFHQNASKGRPFVMRLVLKNVREIRRLDEFILFTFTNKRTVISGEMSFVFKK